MKWNYINIILILVLIVPLLSGLIKGFNLKDSQKELFGIEKDILLLIILTFGISQIAKWNLANLILDKLKENFTFFEKLNVTSNKILYIVIFISIIIIIYNLLLMIVKLINSVTIHPVLNFVSKIASKGGRLAESIFGASFSIPTALINVIIAAFLIKGLTFLPIPNVLIDSINQSSVYNKINTNLIQPTFNSTFVKEFPKILKNSFEIQIIKNGNNENLKDEGKTNNKVANKDGVITLYNGVTLDHGVKSSGDIKNETLKIISGKNSDFERAKAIYEWIGKNITYDDNKAVEVMSGSKSNDSGARSAYATRKGICFDYSCLYVAMAKEAGFKVRLITGEGFNGREWVPHAWNQVFIKSLNKWVNVDSTFYIAGNYFNNKDFSKEHKNDTISGEW